MRTIYFVLLFLLYPSFKTVFGQDTASQWPLNGSIDLSSGFGDYRENRFHAGIDLRTGGRIGMRVIAPVDGYVSRIKTSYFGYGRGLYFTGVDGYTYVFGHLSLYAPEIESMVHSAQIKAERYYLDISLPKDSIPVKKGELLAFSGETGAGAPHLHFEKRTPNNIPLNPLAHGFQLDDKTPPVITEIGFQLVDTFSLLQNGRRELFLPVSGKSGVYKLDTVLYLNAPFGFLAECYDMMNPQGMKQAVYKLSVFVDDSLYFQTLFDSLSYDQVDAAKLVYDYYKASEGEKRVRRLYSKSGAEFAGNSSIRAGKGVYGLENEPPGTKRALIVAEDAFGNRTTLSFSFVWGPQHALFALDSTQITRPNTTTFFFHPTIPLEQIAVDSVVVLLSRGEQWGKPSEVTIQKQDSGKFIAISNSANTATAVLRLQAYTSSGAIVPDTIFNGLTNNNTTKLSMTYEFVDGGLLVAINSQSKLGSRPRIALYNETAKLGTVYPHFFSVYKQIGFIPAQAAFSHITRIGISLSRDSASAPLIIDSLNIIAVGVATEQSFSVDNRLSVRVKQENLYSPQFITLKKSTIRVKGIRGIVSDHYMILPETILTRSPFEMTYRLDAGQAFNPYAGFCWLDKEKDAWVWLGGNANKDVITATSYGGGSFATVIDKEPPTITIFGVRDTMTYTDRRPRISFRIADDLSGIEDDRNFNVKVNNKWVPVEYDAEKKTGTLLMTDPFPIGDQHLAVIVTDRSGHMAERYMRFRIRENPGK